MTVVVGGAYTESCSEPQDCWIFGSGVRAATVLGTHCTRLVTVADPETLSRIRPYLDDVPIDAAHRRAPIRFDYDTPLSPPRLSQHRLDHDIRVDDVATETAVVFGMVEAQPRVSAELVIVDPQNSLDLDALTGTISAAELLIVANRREILRLGDASDLETAVQVVFDRTAAAGVVVKAGALGALVFEPDQPPCGIAAFQTPSVMAIGSGDVFTSELARNYSTSRDLVASANAASRRTAGYVWTQQLAPVNLPSDCPTVPAPTVASVEEPPSIYVAASFATPEQKWSASTMAKGIEDIGAKSIYPLWDVGANRDANETAREDLNELDGCDGVVLLADVARTGPFFEAGWATSRGLPIVVMSSDPDEDRYTMLRGTGAEIVRSLCTAAYRCVWAAISHRHSARNVGRLMLLSGGLDSAAVAAIERPDRALFIAYGQAAAEAEHTAAQQVADHLDIHLDVIAVDASDIGTGSLVSEPQVDLAPNPEWFPFRNQLLVTLGAAHAVKHGLGAVLLGTVAGDGLHQADGTRRFVSSLDALLRTQEGKIRLAAPCADISTPQLLARSRLPREVVAMTHSCDIAIPACGDCNSCRRRQQTLRAVDEGTD